MKDERSPVIEARYRHSETVYIFLLMLLNALTVGMLGPMLPEILDYYKILKMDGALLLVFQGAGAIVAIVAGGLLSTIINKTHLISSSLLLYSLCLIAIIFMPGYIWLLALYFVMGAGTRMLDMMLNAYSSDLCTGNRSFFMSIFHSTFGIGALLAPVYVSLISRIGWQWQQGFLLMGAVLGSIWGIYLIYKAVVFRGHNQLWASPPKAEKGEGSYAVVCKDPAIWIFALIMLLYMGYQYSVMTWGPVYMEEIFAASSEQSGLSVTSFWIGITIGRLWFGRLAGRHHPVRLILVGSVAGIVSLLGMVLSTTSQMMLLFVGVSGLMTGATIPLLMAYVCDQYPPHSGAIASLFFLFSSAGIMVIPWLVSLVAELFSFRAGMTINMIAVGAIALCSALSFSSKLSWKGN